MSWLGGITDSMDMDLSKLQEMVKERGGEGEMYGKSNMETYITICKTDQFSSVTQLCPTPCDPMNHSTPGLPVHHQLPNGFISK